MLDFQVVQAPFRFGVEEGVDPKQVPFGTLLTAKNVVWVKTGRLQKRQGVTALSTGIVGGGSISSAARLLVRGDELALIDGNKLYSRSSGGWVDRGEVPEVGLEWSTLRDDIRGMRSFDQAITSDGKVVSAWVSGSATDLTNGGRLEYQITDATTGTVLTPPTTANSASSGFRIRVLTSGTSWVILYMDGADLRCVTTGGDQQLKTDARNSTEFAALDACVIGSEFVVAYTLQAGGIRLVRYSFASTPAQQATDTVTSESSDDINSVGVCGASGETLYITYYDEDGSKFRFAAANPSTLAQTVAPTDIETGVTGGDGTITCERSSSTTCLVAYSFPRKGNEGSGYRTKSITNAGVITNGCTAFETRLLSRPILLGSKYYVAVASSILTTATSNVTQCETFIVECSLDDTTYHSLREIGKVDWFVGGFWGHGYVCNSIARSATEAWVPMPFISGANVSPNSRASFRQGVKRVRLTRGASLPDDMWRSVSIGQETYFSGQAYDGVEPIAYGFSHPFHINVALTAAATAGSMLDGDYTYNVTGERRSAVGVLHRGPVGIPMTYEVTGPTGSVDLVITPLSIGATSQSTASTALVPIYRTLADGEAAPQRLTLEPQYNVLYNEATTPPLAITDTAPDSDITDGIASGPALSTRPAIYTGGGELEDIQPPFPVTTCLYRNRLFTILGDRQTVAYSKDHSSDPGVAPGFHPALRLIFNDRLVGLEVMDERVFIFADDAIYYTAGDGPAPNGDPPAYDNPNKLQTDVSCTNARGLVSTPFGIMFVSGNEIHLLDRGLSVSWVGKPVQDLLDAYPNVTSAVLVHKKNHVRFTCNNDDGDEGIVLVFDYEEKQWSHFEYVDGVAIADAVIYQDTYTFVTTAGVVYQEDETTHLDAGAWVTSTIETAWVHAAGPVAYHAVRHFRIDGLASSAHGINISVGFNGNTTYQQGPKAFTASAASDIETWNVRVGTRRKCRSIRFKVEDAAPLSLGTGAGPMWSSMGIEVGIKKGLGRLPPAQRL